MRDMNKLSEVIAALEGHVRTVELAGAELVAQSAKDRAPVETGKLRDAIHTEETPEGVLVVAGDKNVFYGHMVEHGTTHSAPHPFLVPALEEGQAEIISMVREAIAKAVQ